MHVFIYRRPTDMVLIEYVDMTPDDSEKYITWDSLNAMVFWQGHQTHHMRKHNVRMHHATLFHHRLLLAPPRARTGQFLRCHVNSEMFLYNVTSDLVMLLRAIVIFQPALAYIHGDTYKL